MKQLICLFFTFITTTIFAAPITAITIALEPDDIMVSKAISANDIIRASYPQGFRLDKSHHPHLTIVQSYVHTSDLQNLYKAVGKIFAKEKIQSLKLEAEKYDSLTWAGLAVIMIKVTKSKELVNLQSQIVEGIRPFVVNQNTPEAFSTNKSEPVINQETMDHVVKFIPESLGENYEPNVTVGVAPIEVMEKKLAGTFGKFNFSPIALSIFKIGNFGAAHTRLKTWKLKK